MSLHNLFKQKTKDFVVKSDQHFLQPDNTQQTSTPHRQKGITIKEMSEVNIKINILDETKKDLEDSICKGSG